MGTRVRKLGKGDEIFKEGDEPTAMFIIKSGRVAITKSKGSSSVTLAELKQGDMIGEMAFFEKKPRSASAKALSPGTEIIELPFPALDKQYESMPVWLKAVMKTVSAHLRKANAKIRQLEKSQQDIADVFSDHEITQLASILGFVASRYGTEHPSGLQVPAGTLRKYTIQVFKLPTHKMQTLIETLTEQGSMDVLKLEDGKQQLILKDIDFLFQFAEFSNEQMFSDEARKHSLSKEQLHSMQTLCHYGKDLTPNGKGLVKVNVTEAAKKSQQELGLKIVTRDVEVLSEVGLLGEFTNDQEAQFVETPVEHLTEICSHWDLYYRLKSFQNP